jgi:hypothetical protein
MRVYNRAMSEQSWNTLEEYLDAPTVRWYGTGAESFSDYSLLAGHWLSSLTPPPAGEMLDQDLFGEVVSTRVSQRPPEYLWEESGSDYEAASLWRALRDLICRFIPVLCKKRPKPKPDPLNECHKICDENCRNDPNYKYPYVPPEDLIACDPHLIVPAGIPYEIPPWSREYADCYMECLRRCLAERAPKPAPGRGERPYVIPCVPFPPIAPVPFPSPTPAPVPVPII